MINNNDHNRLPQAHGVDTDNIIEETDNKFPHERSPCLFSLPSEVLVSQLSYLSIQDIETSVQYTCKVFNRLCNTQHLWREFCQQTGKLNENDSPDSISNISHNNDQIDYRQLYMSTPCVPIDFPNIMAALDYYPIVREKLPSSTFTVTLMPGVYHEQIQLDAKYYEILSNKGHSGLLHFNIRAAFHDKGAAIIHYDQNDTNQPCVSIINQSDTLSGNGESSDERSMFSVTIQDIQCLHYTIGNDIWNGNCALQVDGCNLNVNISSCSFQSDSGRGIVVSRGAQIYMSDTTVHDCAATGIYIGDLDSSARIERCNITRNGGGTRIPTTGTEESDQNVRNSPTNSNANDNVSHMNMSSLHGDNAYHSHQLVPPGHSGMYLEASTAIVNDCLLSKNSLTGLSVVRGGETKVSGCDVFGNGSSPVTIEDAHDVLLGLGEGIRGGIEDLGGNYFSGGNDWDNGRNENVVMRNENVNMIDRTRKTMFPTVNYEHTTVERLRFLYNS